MIGHQLFVGNLDYDVTPEELTATFAAHGQVVSVNIIERRGFGFVTMATEDGATGAKAALDGTTLKGRNIAVKDALPPKKQQDKRPHSERSRDHGDR